MRFKAESSFSIFPGKILSENWLYSFPIPCAWTLWGFCFVFVFVLTLVLHMDEIVKAISCTCVPLYTHTYVHRHLSHYSDYILKLINYSCPSRAQVTNSPDYPALTHKACSQGWGPVLENPGKVQRFPKEKIFKFCSELCCHYLEQSDSLPKWFSFHLFW